MTVEPVDLKLVVYEQLARVSKALASGKRLHLLELLAQAERSVEVLARESGLGVTSVSSHLQILRAAGLVRTRRERTTIFYRLAGAEVADLFVGMKDFGLENLPDLRDALSDYLSTAGHDEAGETTVARRDVTTGDVVMLDVRPRPEFDAGHYPGAVSIPLVELPARIGELSTDRLVVVYCRGEFCRLAREAARMLRAAGVDAAAMDEGVLEWLASGEVALDATA